MCGFLVSTDSIDRSDFETAFETIEHRGPDSSVKLQLPQGGIFGFHRLAIVDKSSAGNQPFTSHSNATALVCNGEIFNHKQLKHKFASDYPLRSKSDCEVLLPVFEKFGIEKLCQQLDAEFALVIYDHKENSWCAARDPIGIRPLFYGYHQEGGHIIFASEAKALKQICIEISTFPPGHYYRDGKFICYAKSPWLDDTREAEEEEQICLNIRQLLTTAVEKRLHADVPLGYLLSGGLDSSLICAIAAQNSEQPITTFAVGFEDKPIDTKYARQVAKHIGSDHHEVLFSKKQVSDVLEKLIYQLETFDITTVRASVGMYLLCEYIKENTDIKVLLTGEVSDEMFGYKYTDFAPSPDAFQKESIAKMEELFMYDVLRADRCISAHSLEARVPFADHDFVDYVMGIHPSLKMNTKGIGKYLLRKSFADTGLLPESILYRDKAAFSDAVGHGMVDYLKQLAEEKISDQELLEAQSNIGHVTPISKESLLYRQVFDSYFPGLSHLVKKFWMPNSSWKNCDVDDPSARVLPNYGDPE